MFKFVVHRKRMQDFKRTGENMLKDIEKRMVCGLRMYVQLKR